MTAAELCAHCGQEVRMMIYRGTGRCSARCAKARTP